MSRFVEISFDCLPLRSVGRLDIPIDASPKYRAHCERVKHALETYGTYNTYFLYNANCIFHLTNEPEVGMLEFRFSGTVFTDESDRKTRDCHLNVELVRETCDWLTQPAVEWFSQTVPKAVAVDFDRYIAAGDLAKTVERIQAIQSASDSGGGYVGMYL